MRQSLCGLSGAREEGEPSVGPSLYGPTDAFRLWCAGSVPRPPEGRVVSYPILYFCSHLPLTVCCGMPAVYLASLNDEQSTALAVSQFQSAANMTDQFAALASVCMHDTPQRAEALAQFYEQWKHDGLVRHGDRCSL